ncbi:MAG: type II and III secretion system protein family protein [Gammaproteobacteria bacterium]
MSNFKMPHYFYSIKGIVATFFLVFTQVGWAVENCAQADSLKVSLKLIVGLQEELKLPVAIQRLAVGDPNVADVQLTSPQSFIITPKKGGVTNLSVWTNCSIDAQQSMLFVEGAATAALNSEVSSETVLPNVVQTDIRFVEVSRSKLREVGVSMLGAGSRNFLFGSPNTSPSSVPVGSVGQLTPGVDMPLSESGFNIVWGGGSAKVLAALNALERSGFAYTLSQPSLVAMSGQNASFLAGGEFPVPVPTAASDSYSIQFKEFGVRLNITPTVISHKRIVLKVAPEVSELDFNNGVMIAGTAVPALSIRRTDTSVSLADGESFIISGLTSTSNQATVNKFPGLGDVPYLGAFFRTTRVDREERELLMIVTPHLIQPLAVDAVLPSLPGESVRQYAPSLFDQLFDSEGEFTEIQGLSR